MLIAIILVMAIWGSKLIPDREGGEYLAKEPDYSNIPAWKGWVTLIVFVVSVIGMSLTSYVKWLPPMHIIVSLACLVLLLTKTITQKQAFDAIDLQTIFSISFVTPLGTALKSSGASDLLANGVKMVFGSSNPILITAVI